MVVWVSVVPALETEPIEVLEWLVQLGGTCGGVGFWGRGTYVYVQV